jgi:hypothetical protein
MGDQPGEPTAAVTEPVLAIRTDDLFLHVGPSAVVSGHLNAVAADSGVPISPNLEFYDATGLRLALGEDGFTPVPDQPEPTDLDRQILVDWIDLVHAELQVLLDRTIRDTPAGERPLPALRIPRFGGPLAGVLQTIARLAGDLPAPEDTTPGDVWHKIFYHLTGTRH